MVQILSIERVQWSKGISNTHGESQLIYRVDEDKRQTAKRVRLEVATPPFLNTIVVKLISLEAIIGFAPHLVFVKTRVVGDASLVRLFVTEYGQNQ